MPFWLDYGYGLQFRGMKVKTDVFSALCLLGNTNSSYPTS